MRRAHPDHAGKGVSVRAESSGGPIINLHGERVALGPVTREIVPLYERWMNDFAILRMQGAIFRGITSESAEGWYEDVSRDRRNVTFAVYERVTMRPIGIAGLNDIMPPHGTAEYWITIGEQDCWGKGYGTETTRLVLAYGFTALGLRNIMLKVHAFNERGIRAYQRAGFRLIGRRRQAIPLAGARHDDVFMDCIAEEFDGPSLDEIMA
jgi:RimJ/RimL family protein N-acetyltransferase